MKLPDVLRVRLAQGAPTIPDPRAARAEGFRGLPVLGSVACPAGCSACVDACPSGAITAAPLTLDLGRCAFCAECAEACPDGAIDFSSDPRMGATRREDLVLVAGAPARSEVTASPSLARVFGRSLRMRPVSAGGCNACELELNAATNVNFDVQRYGVEWVASPRHADALVLTGPLTRTMRDAVRLAWDAMPEPRFLVAVGACAISGGLHVGPAADRTFLEEVGPALFVPGCPPHPLTFVNAILDFVDARR